DDMVEAFVRVGRVGNSSLTMLVDLCHADSGDLHASVEIISAHVDLEARRSKPIPDNVRERLDVLTG
ncbi:MAG: acyl-CoA thioesterase, partial [Sphingomonadales bacterium]